MNKFTLIENKAIDKPVEYVVLNIAEQSDDTGDQYLRREDGSWVQLGLATRFTEEERIKFSLPVNGLWVNMTEMMHAMEMSKSNHPTTGFRKPRLTIVDESE